MWHDFSWSWSLDHYHDNDKSFFNNVTDHMCKTALSFLIHWQGEEISFFDLHSHLTWYYLHWKTFRRLRGPSKSGELFKFQDSFNWSSEWLFVMKHKKFLYQTPPSQYLNILENRFFCPDTNTLNIVTCYLGLCKSITCIVFLIVCQQRSNWLFGHYWTLTSLLGVK